MSCYEDPYFYYRQTPGAQVPDMPLTTMPDYMMQPYAGMLAPTLMPPAMQLPSPVTPLPTPPMVTPMDAVTVPETVMSPLYIPGYLRSQIGKKIRVEFLIGTNGPLIDRSGTLLGVGTSYILLRPDESDDILMADLYSIKFATTVL